MRSIINYFKEIALGVWSLLKGMKVTGSYFFQSFLNCDPEISQQQENACYVRPFQGGGHYAAQ